MRLCNSGFWILASRFFSTSIIGISFALLVLLNVGTALAAGPSASSTLQMSGQATVEQTREQQRLLFSVDSIDGSGWRLDVTLVPTGVRRQGGFGDGGEVILLGGTYQLSGPGVSTISGRAVAQVDRGGTGQVQLVDAADATALKAAQAPLSATFSIDDSGQVNLNLLGPLPAPAAPAVSADAATQPVDHTFWYVSRAAGFTAYALLTLTVCLGLMVRTRLLEAIVARWRSFDLHQFTALLALAFVALHIFSLLGDQYIGFQFDQLFIPLASPYRPVQVALGIIGLYVMIVVVGSFYVRRSISYQTWRTIHYATFGLFLLVLAHGVLSGTDSGQPWARAIYWGTGLLVATLTLWRMRQGSDQKRPKRPVEARVTESAAAR